VDTCYLPASLLGEDLRVFPVVLSPGLSAVLCYVFPTRYKGFHPSSPLFDSINTSFCCQAPAASLTLHPRKKLLSVLLGGQGWDLCSWGAFSLANPISRTEYSS